MIKKLNIDELKPGMYVCALERDGSSEALSFMNNILVGSEEDVERFRKAGYKAAHVDLPDEEADQTPSDAAGHVHGDSGDSVQDYGEVEILGNSPNDPGEGAETGGQGGLSSVAGEKGGRGGSRGYRGVDSGGSAAPEIFSGPVEPGHHEVGDEKGPELYEVDLDNTGFIDDLEPEEAWLAESPSEGADGLELDSGTDFDLSGGMDDFAPTGTIDDLGIVEGAPEGLGGEPGGGPADTPQEGPGQYPERSEDVVIEETIEALDEEMEGVPGMPGSVEGEALEHTGSDDARNPLEPDESIGRAGDGAAGEEWSTRAGEPVDEAYPEASPEETALEEAPLLDTEDGEPDQDPSVSTIFSASEDLFTGNDYVCKEAPEDAGAFGAAVEPAGADTDEPAEEVVAADEEEESADGELEPLEGNDFLENPVVVACDDGGQDRGEKAAGPTGPARPDYKEQFRDYKEELDDAKRIRNEAEGLVREFLVNVKEGEGIQTEKVHSTVENMVDSIFRNQDALTSLARLKSFDDYTFAHCVNVCTLTITLGRHMGLGRDRLQELGVGSILHDVGKMLVPEDILNKPGKLTDEEFKVMRDHTVMGAELLDKTSGITAEARDVALHHHELFDGKGYPRGLSGKEINEFARITTVADVYDAMTSNRVYQRGMKADEALKKMYMWRGERFEPQLVERLIRCLGIYPIGTLVEINTGEIAVVRLPNHTNPLKPLVMMIYDKDGNAYSKPFASALGDDEERWITGSRNPDEFGTALKDLTACV